MAALFVGAFIANLFNEAARTRRPATPSAPLVSESRWRSTSRKQPAEI